MVNISDIPWSEFAISDVRVTYISDSLSKRRTFRDTGVLRYEIELTTQEMKDRIGRGVKAKLSRAHNQVMTFVHPRRGFTQGHEPLSKIQVTSALKGADSITLTSVEAWQLLAGDYIQMPNSTKMYEVAEDTALVTGDQDVELTGQIIIESLSGNIACNNVAFYLVSNGIIESSESASEDQDIQITLTLVENL